mmetsp:Transcript_13461/g.40830  ORF Transcript_13461/g.40830 Transcript_13461/m.40830 type:complete len:161 (+) Transcript_13461:2655-3137(+)
MVMVTPNHSSCPTRLHSSTHRPPSPRYQPSRPIVRGMAREVSLLAVMNAEQAKSQRVLRPYRKPLHPSGIWTDAGCRRGGTREETLPTSYAATYASVVAWNTWLSPSLSLAFAVRSLVASRAVSYITHSGSAAPSSRSPSPSCHSWHTPSSLYTLFLQQN